MTVVVLPGGCWSEEEKWSESALGGVGVCAVVCGVVVGVGWLWCKH